MGSCIFFLFGSEEMDSGFLYRFLMFLRGIGNYIGLVWKMVKLISSHRYLMLFSVRLSFLCVFFLGTSECPVFVILFFLKLFPL